MDYRKLNISTGWFVWAIATFVFVNTIESTASFWDCGEFIATAYRLEVGHPPGAPFFMLIGRLFSMFTGPENAAYMINICSALCSSFTILFLFWTVTAFAKKLALKSGEMDLGKQIAVMGSGVVGALAYTFSDSFWFSAAEGEVYAMSSLFTAIVFWAIMKWEASDSPYADRWLILICYLMGLSIGVHLLNLLAIPAITFVYAFKRFPNLNTKQFVITGVVSILILGFIQAGVIPWTVIIASQFEKLFVNSFGLPFNSGIFFYIVLLVAGIVWALWFTHQKQAVIWNKMILCLTVILIGYSSFAVIMIRSSADPPMDENNPENAFSLLSYLNREQYGDRPLLYGHYFNAPLDKSEPYKDGSPVWTQDKDKGVYFVSDDKKNSSANYDKKFCGIFPRMYSSDGKHVRAYKSWSGADGKRKPSFSENMKFFFTYQIGWMYGRYFMWNFAGKQNDIQGHGNILHGNWISGIPFIDERLGPQENIPFELEDNAARNKFYMLPLLLGLLGLIFQMSRDKKDGFIVFLLFFFTGIAIVIYLNQYPYQPRERDYAYAGSFYGFAIWIGLGVMALYDVLRKGIPGVAAASLVSVTSLLLVPGIMAKDGWDDHDRSDRYTARDFAKNYLSSCAPNAILFTNGDNDTFPLWYVQEVEGFRTDVRVCNLSLLNTDWYIDQMRRKAYDSDPVPFGMDPSKYRQGTRDYVPIFEKLPSDFYTEVKDGIEYISDDKNMAHLGGGKRLNFFPSKNFKITIDKDKVISNGTIDPKDADRVVDEIKWRINKSYVLKNDMMILDLLANNDWDRPVYFAITTGNDSYIGLQKHFQLEGLAYRLIPVIAESPDGQTGEVNTDLMYDNLMNKFVWGGMDKGKIYMDENNRRMCMNLRNNFARLAENLLREKKKDKAIEVLDRCLEVMPEHNVPYNFFMLPVAEVYYKCGEFEKANAIVNRLAEVYDRELAYYFSLDDEMFKSIQKDAQQSMSIYYRMSLLTKNTYKQKELGDDLEQRFNALQSTFGYRMGMGPGVNDEDMD